MKKFYKQLKFTSRWTLLSLFLAFFLFAESQEAPEDLLVKGEFEGGLKIGLITSQIYGDNFGGYNKLGLWSGAFVRTKFRRNTDVQLEINYANRGSRDPAKPDKGKFDSYRISSHYIDIPILARFWVWKFHLEAGISNCIYLNHSERDQNGKIPKDLRGTTFSRYELAANLGIQWKLNDNWYLNPRFHYSLLPINPGGLNYIPNFGFAGGMFNNAIMVSINRVFRGK